MATTPRPLPHDLDAEEALLGAMLFSTDAVVAAMETCGAADFYRPAHRHIFGAIVSLFEASEPVDPITVAAELRHRGVLDQIGDPALLVELLGNTASPANARHYARIVAEHAGHRRRAAAAREILDAELDGDIERARAATEQLLDAADVRDDGPSSWEPLDLLSIDLDPVRPTVLERTDGSPLLYGGKVNSLAGEPEAGKTHLALYGCAQEIGAGRHAMFLDFEGGPTDILERLLAMGCDKADVAERFHYVRPDAPLGPAERRRLEQLLDLYEPSLVVIDGMAEALAIESLDENSAADVTRFLVMLPRACSRAGAAVLILDHLTKDRETRGRYARGSGAKLAGIDGAGFHLSTQRPFARGTDGQSRLDVVKDRHGHVRSLAATGTATVADIRLTSLADGAIRIEIHAPAPAGAFRPTNLMERLSRYIEINPGLSQRQLREHVQGKAEALATALRTLIDEGYVIAEEGSRGASLHKSVRPYREGEDDDE